MTDSSGGTRSDTTTASPLGRESAPGPHGGQAGTSATGAPWGAGRVLAPATVAILLLITTSGLYLVWLARPLWFLLDDWEFLLHREVTLTGEESLLQPHNEHWGLLPILVFRALFWVAGMESYLPYVLVTIGLHLLVCALFAAVLRRCGAEPWVAVLVIAVLAFFGPGGFTIFWDFQMGFIGPTALALAGVLLVDRGPTLPRYPVAVWAVLVAALMSSGAGITMVAWVAAYTWLRRSLRSAVVVGLPPTVLFVAWYLTYGRGNSPAPPAPPELIVPYILRGITNLWNTIVPIPWLGVLVIVLITAATIAGRHHPRLRAFAASGLMALVFNYLVLALARAGWGLDQATSTRYLYVGAFLTLPAFALGLQLLWERLGGYPRPRALIWLVMGVLFVGSGVRLLHGDAVLHELGVAGSKGRVVAAAQLVEQGAPRLSQVVDPEIAPDIDAASLGRAEVRDRLPRVRPTFRERLDTAGYLQVGVSGASFGLPPADGVTVHGTQDADAQGACRDLLVRAGATVVLRPTATGSEVTLAVSQDRITTRLVRDGRASIHWGHEVTPGETIHVGSVAPDARLRITVPSGPLTLCTAGDLTTRR